MVPEITLPNASNVRQSGLLYNLTILIKRGPSALHYDNCLNKGVSFLPEYILSNFFLVADALDGI
jgi:hypothetical protein